MDVIKILIDHNADLSIKNENGQTPRDIAIEMAEELNAKGTNAIISEHIITFINKSHNIIFEQDMNTHGSMLFWKLLKTKPNYSDILNQPISISTVDAISKNEIWKTYITFWEMVLVLNRYHLEIIKSEIYLETL